MVPEMRGKTLAEDKRAIRRIRLAQKILQLAHQAGWREGHHLTELGLCELLQVSRSPVRAALAVLAEWGAVVSRPNQGYFLSRDADDLLTLGREVPPSVEEDLYLAIMDARLAGRIGDSVTQAEVMARFRSPRGLVERVLARMAEDGLMERLKGRGWQFLPTFEGVRSWAHSYQLRLLLEPGGILLPQFRIDHEKLSACRIAHRDLLAAVTAGGEPAPWIYQVDADFHELIAAFSNNAFFLQAVQHQNRLRRLLEYRGYGNRRRIADWCREHLAIIEALERQQIERAAECMRRHLEQAATATRDLSLSTAS